MDSDSDDSGPERSASNFRAGLLGGPSINANTKNAQGVKHLYEGERDRHGNIMWQDDYPAGLSESKIQNEAIILRHQLSLQFEGSGPLELHSITFRQPALRAAIQKILEGYPGISTADCDLTFDRPFASFYFRWTELEKAALDAPSEYRELLHMVVETLRSSLSSALDSAPALIERRETNYELLWTVFPLGTVTIGQYNGDDHLFIVSGTRYVDSPFLKAFVVDLVHLDYDGEMYGWVDTSVTIGAFESIKRIMEFRTVPIEYCDAAKEKIRHLSERGAKACALAPGAYKSHRGMMTVFGFSPHLRRPKLEPVENFSEGRIIIDVMEYLNNVEDDSIKALIIPTGLGTLAGVDDSRRRRRSSADSLPPFPFDQLGIREQGALHSQKPSLHRTRSETDLLSMHRWTSNALGMPPEAFCRGAVRGYCLSTKSWATFRVHNISDITWNETAFDQLVMSEARKSLLKAVVDEQSRNKAEHDDIVQGKGLGLIMLFHGPPGTGKTLTAESIADRLRLPLYSIDAGQLGDDMENIEERARKVLRLAASWEAVLLLDEADVFMGKRVADTSPRAKQNNERVAAFLRLLEYYKGILILTTNRPLDFDEAFYSRIHLTLRFPPLDAQSRLAIWRNFLLPDAISSTQEELSALSELPQNGRQIKNIVKLARLLAYNKGEKLQISHVRSVLSVLEEDVEKTDTQG